MSQVKPTDRELELAKASFEGTNDIAKLLATYRRELEDSFNEERLKLDAKVKAMEVKVLEIFKDKSPAHFGLENSDYGKGYMAAIAAIADDSSDQYKDVALRITDKRLRQEDIAFVSLRNTRGGEPTCRVLRIRDDGTSEAGEGRALDVAMANLQAAPKPDLL